MAKKTVYAIAGPTASGKTGLSITLAKLLNAEIISVDSALVYKGLDIGSAKPTIKERSGIPHHLIDIRQPWENYSVTVFLKDSLALVEQIQAQGKKVLFVGGTMLYYKALIEGISSLPEADSVLRLKMQKKPLSHWYAYLNNHDPLTSTQLASNDKQRILRACEVILLTGKTYSQVISENPKIGALAQHIQMLALVPSDRKTLHERIALRFHKMLSEGFIDEVNHLKACKRMHLDLPAMRSVGYRQAWQYLAGEYDYDTFIEKGIVATRQLAKRQLTWIRNWPYAIKEIDANQSDEVKLSQAAEYFSAS